MIPSSWLPEFGETADLLLNSRAMLEPIIEETSEEEDNPELWCHYDSIWSSESDTGSVIRVDLAQDCTSEREFACPPKRRKHHEFDLFEERATSQIRKMDGPEYFGKRTDLRIQRFDEFQFGGDMFSDSDSLSFASLSRSSSLIQFESLEKQMQSDTTSYGSSPSLYSQISAEMENTFTKLKTNDEPKILKIYHPSATTCTTAISESSSDTDSSLSSGGATSSSMSNLKIRISEKPQLDFDATKREIIKEKNSIESLSEDSGYSENISFLRTKSYSIPCLRRKKFQSEHSQNTISESSKSLEDVSPSSLQPHYHQHHSNHLYLDSRSSLTPSSSCITIRKISTKQSDDALLDTSAAAMAPTNLSYTRNSGNSASPPVAKKTNSNETKNKCEIPRHFISTRSPILHEEIGLLFNGSSSSGTRRDGNSPDFSSKSKINYMNSIKDLYVVSSVPENLNICGNFECVNNSSFDSDQELEEGEEDRYGSGGGDLFDSFDEWNTPLPPVTSKTVNFYNFDNFNPALTMSYANLTLLSDDMGSSDTRPNSFRNSLERPKPKESSILCEYSVNFDKDVSILTDRAINHEPVKKVPPPPPPRRIKPKSPDVPVAESRLTFDRDPTNLVTCYTESLERCNFDLNPPSNPPSRLNSNDCLVIKSQPLSNFNSFVSSTPNLNVYTSADAHPRTEFHYKSMRHITSTSSKGNLSKGVSFCPIVSEISWKETPRDHQSSFEDSLDGDDEYYEDDEDDDDDDERNDNRHQYHFSDPIHDDDDYTDLNPPTTQIFSSTFNTTTLATSQQQPPLTNTPMLYSSFGKTDRQHIINTTRSDVNNTHALALSSSSSPPSSSTHTTKPNTTQEIGEKKNEFSCNTTIMDTVQTEQLAPTKEELPQKQQQQHNKLSNANNKLIVIKKMDQPEVVQTPTQQHSTTTSSVAAMDSKPQQRENNNKKQKLGGGFFSRFSNFRFSLKSKDKKKNKIKNFSENNANSSATSSSNNKDQSGVTVKNDLGIFNNNNKHNKNEVMLKNSDFVFIPLHGPTTTVHNNNTAAENIPTINITETNHHHHHNNNKDVYKNRKQSSSTDDEMDYRNNEMATAANGIDTTTAMNGVNNHHNNNGHQHMLLTSKPPLPKLPPRVIGVSTKRTNSAHAPHHQPNNTPTRRAKSMPRDGDEFDDGYLENSLVDTLRTPSHHRQSFDSHNRFIMSEKQYYYNQAAKNASGGNRNGNYGGDNESKIGLIETNLDTHETIVTGKTRSLMELIPNQYNSGDNSNFNKSANVNGDSHHHAAEQQSRRPHKSMEFLLDKENQKGVLPPENELQKSHECNTLSEHQLRVQASLQRLNIPDWFKQYNSPNQTLNPDTGYTTSILRKRNSDVAASGRWAGLNSKTTSLSSLGSHRSDKSPLMLSPSAHSHHGQTGFSRWSTSHLNSTQTSPSISTKGPFVRGHLNASTASGTSNNTIRTSLRQPYMGWRSQEKLSQPRTPHERLASSILKHQSSQPQANPKQTEEIQSSIKEVTSAIVHYVNDQTNRTSTRSRSASPNTRKCWLESSFVGNRPLESPQTPIIDKSMHEANGSIDGAKYNSVTPNIPGFSIQQERTSPGSATLEDVLASLLGLPLESHRSSEISANNNLQPEASSSHLQVDQVSLRRRSEGDAQKRNASANPTVQTPHRRVSLDSCDSKPSDVMKCRYPKCDATATANDAKKFYKSCHNCSNMYCSRECRRAHWEKHRKACLHSRVSSLCRQVLSQCKDDADTLRHLSLVARKGYLSHGRGVVRILFRSPESADVFIKQGFQFMGEAAYVRWADLLPAEMGPELYSELLRLSTEYKPDSKMLIYVAICVVSEAPSSGTAPVKWERQLVSRCAKLKLCKSMIQETTTTIQMEQQQSMDILILTFTMVNRNFQKARDLISKNIQLVLRERGVNLRKHFPEVFQRLCSYVEGTAERFLPVTIHPRDSTTGKSFICIIMPNNCGEIKMPITEGGNRVQTIDVSLDRFEPTQTGNRTSSPQILPSVH